MDRHNPVILAALLHDIGKFGERTAEPLPVWAEPFHHEARYTHEPYSAVFVEEQLGRWPLDMTTVRRLVLKHHAPSLPDELLVSLADRLSAYERAEAEGDREGARGRAETALRTVFSRLLGVSADGARYHELADLSLDRRALFPRPDAVGSVESYRALWERFTSEVARVPLGDLRTLLAVLRRFTWVIPSDTRRDLIPDISLYHHLKTTAAIAACLVREELGEFDVRTLHDGLTNRWKKAPLTPREEELLHRPLCALVKGDISGTQDFLYLLTSRGAARGLRGRSFYLQLLTETIAEWILRQFQLHPTNVLFVGGGHFYLLLPYRAAAEHLDGIQQRIARVLWKIHKGDLSLLVASVPVAAIDFLEEEAGGNAFAAKWGDVSRRVNEEKQRKWQDLGQEGMRRELFISRQRGMTAEDTCQVCHNAGALEIQDDVRKCQHCRGFEELGRLLRDPTHLVLFTVPEAEPPEQADWRDALRAFGTEAWLIHEGDVLPRRPPGATEARVYTLDATDFLDEDTCRRFRWGDLPVSYDFRWLADATPRKHDEHGQEVIAEFADLAEASQGVKWLGVLRMDVDGLGDVFKNGLGAQATISRMSTLSESLRLFFEAWVPRLCREYNRFQQGKKDALYLIYAGGDDLFVVGAWSVLPELAERIRDDFRELVGGDHVTLSAGIAIEHPKFPLYQLAANARHALDDQAKEFQRSNGRAKDAVSFLQTAMGWEEFARIAGWKDALLQMLNPQGEEPALPRAFLMRLMEIHALYAGNRARWRRAQRLREITHEQMEELIHYDKWQWRLVYHLSRFAERHEQHRETIDRLLREIVQQDGFIARLRVLARWAELLTREG
ncbi:MAG TPA: type III-A CRISPR-associated protein Cas10/Csm1 [Blastocatellia bacterium]|nr:type III-A CRISPR-associated protein Cas10/Csm1 [Blastocatellia bacterium]